MKHPPPKPTDGNPWVPPSLITDPHQLASNIRAYALSLGFNLVGIAPSHPSAYRDYLRQWLDTGQAGTMDWLSKRFEERTNPSTYLPNAQSIICVAINYHVPITPTDSPHQGKIAQYALGDDYHKIFTPKLRSLADHIRTLSPDDQTKAAVDTAPVMEKELAQRAGLGWIGKNTCLINPHIGSWLLLGEVLTTLLLPPDQPGIDRCGTCRRCLDACPTHAFTAPYQMDATKCISYLTIEHRADDIPPHLQSQIGHWLYGCDICQDVCPFNSKAPLSDIRPRFPTAAFNVQEIANWTPDQYRQILKGTAIKRVKLPVLQRNARIVQKNSHAP